MQFLISLLIQVLFFLNFLFSETFIYEAGFRFFNAGTAIIEIEKITYKDSSANKINYKIKTNSFLDKFYMIRDEIDLIVDSYDYSLISINKNIKQGRYTEKYEYKVNSDSILNLNSQISDDNIKKTYYDPIGAIFMLRKENLQIGNQFSFFTFDMGQINEVLVVVESIENIDVPAGNFDCFKVTPQSSDGKNLFKNGGDMRIWYSLDSKHLPVRVEQKSNYGTIVLKLKSAID